MRGATIGDCIFFNCLVISIHAPHAGCDPATGARSRSSSHFNPRTPCGVRLRNLTAEARYPDFNPRTPCGVRQNASCSVRFCSIFQSTHPMRGATGSLRSLPPLPVFQSTHPMRGATRAGFCREADPNDFNPRTPCGVRRGSVR